MPRRTASRPHSLHIPAMLQVIVSGVGFRRPRKEITA
jgi:hypothetical protein